MSNKELKKLLLDIDNKARSSINNEDLLSSVRMAIDYGKPIVFDLKTSKIILFISSFIFVATLSFFIFSEMRMLNTEILYYFKVIGTISVISFILMFASALNCFLKNNLIENTSNYIREKDTFQDNNIQKIDVLDYGFVGAENLEKEFQEFDRGNHTREFNKAYSIDKCDKLRDKKCFFYQFHYVDKYTVVVPTTSTDAKGNVTVGTRIETRYNHYNRYGIVYNFNIFNNIKILHDKTPDNKVDYNSSSIAFSEKFKVGANSDMDASKFLKSSVVENILKLDNIVSSLNIEINDSGLMCVSFDDNDLISVKSKHTLSEPVLFYEELKGKTELHKLNSILSCIVNLEKQLDNNFKKDE